MSEGRERGARLALQGTALGDGFGRAFGLGPEDPESRLRRRELPPGPWPWSDDTVMAAAVTEILLRHGRVAQDELAMSFARRYEADPDRGYGAVAVHILARIAQGDDWRVANQVYGGKGSLGNGAAMRVAPVGAYFSDDVERVVREADRSAEVTHAHPEGRAGAVAVAVTAAWLRARSPGEFAPGELLDHALRFTPAGRVRDGIAAAARARGWSAHDVAEVVGDGGQITAADTVPFALWVVAHQPRSFDGALFEAMGGLLGEAADRDTVCAIVGALVALSVGEPGLPPRWLACVEPLPPVQAPALA